ncbi:MAG: hypothetical protein U5K28_10795 [Halobacteriales archaeon]|nr:hypothetical protein [Halobacteriales archaeon]
MVYTVIVFVPWGTPTIAAAVGATMAEGILDFFEGLEPDEPFGWAGYIVGFTIAGYFMKDPSNKVKLAIGAVLGGFIQFAIEGLNLFVVSRMMRYRCTHSRSQETPSRTASSSVRFR